MQTQQLANVDAEREVLGAVFRKPGKIYDLATRLKPEDFYRSSHRVLYETLLAMSLAKVPIDIVSVTETLRQSGKLEAAGGVVAVTAVAGCAVTAANMAHHAAVVADYARRRRAVELANEIKQAAEDEANGLNPAEFQAKLATLALGDANTVKPLSENLVEFCAWLENLAANVGIRTGLTALDDLTGEWRPSDLVIIAARPGMGKTALGVTCAVNAVKAGKKVAFFSLEMSTNQLLARIVAAESFINSKRIIGAKDLEQWEWDKILKASAAISQWPLYIEDKAVTTPLSILARARQIQGQYGLDIIFVDYLQLMQGGGKFSRSDNRTSEVGYISRALKLMAKELNVPVVALSQLNRAVEKQADKRPNMADLRDSGSIEQDADQILLLYREKYYNADCSHDMTEVNLAKNRHGQTGIAKIKFMPQYTKFVNG